MNNNKNMINYKEANVPVADIMLDPRNPRFAGKTTKMSQAEIKRIMESRKDTKELKRSMKEKLMWVNKIVVIPVVDLPEEVRADIPEAENYEYIVVEGNTRLTCLKSEDLQKEYGDSIREIPVLIVERGNLSDEEFAMELKNVQTIANVMVVKEWDEVPKQKHVYETFLLERELHPEESPAEAIKKIEESTGVRRDRVKSSIVRCMIADKIAEESDELEDDYWQFLEAFETNSDTRQSIGLNDKYEFAFDTDHEDLQRELINTIPEMVKNASRCVKKCKDFRDKYKQIVSDCNCDVESIVKEIKDIMDDAQPNKTWDKGVAEVSDEKKWVADLKDIMNKISKYPVVADWAANNKKHLEDVRNKINEILGYLELKK